MHTTLIVLGGIVLYALAVRFIGAFCGFNGGKGGLRYPDAPKKSECKHCAPHKCDCVPQDLT